MEFALNDIDDSKETIKDFILSEIIYNLSLSNKELQVCSEFGISKFKDKKFNFSKDELSRIAKFKKYTSELYEENI